MDDILIVSDSSIAHSALETILRNAHFPADLIALLGVLAMFGAASYLARQYKFVLLVIDADFRKRYGSALTEMSAIIRNYSSHTSLYLLFEDDYEASSSSWLPHSKRVFRKIANQDKLEKAVQEIIRLELDVKDYQER